jgi:hypothetical protein
MIDEKKLGERLVSIKPSLVLFLLRNSPLAKDIKEFP